MEFEVELSWHVPALRADEGLTANFEGQREAEEETFDAIRRGDEPAALKALRLWAQLKDAHPDVLLAALDRIARM